MKKIMYLIVIFSLIPTLLFFLLYYDSIEINTENSLNGIPINQTESVVDGYFWEEIELNIINNDNNSYVSFNGSFELGNLIGFNQPLYAFISSNELVNYNSSNEYIFDSGYIWLQGMEEYKIEISNIYIVATFDSAGYYYGYIHNYSLPFDFPHMLECFSLVVGYGIEHFPTLDSWWNDGIDIEDVSNAIVYAIRILAYPIDIVVFGVRLFKIGSFVFGGVVS